jgi:hypothetical protein
MILGATAWRALVRNYVDVLVRSREVRTSLGCLDLWASTDIIRLLVAKKTYLVCALRWRQRKQRWPKFLGNGGLVIPTLKKEYTHQDDSARRGRSVRS